MSSRTAISVGCNTDTCSPTATKQCFRLAPIGSVRQSAIPSAGLAVTSMRFLTRPTKQYGW